MIICGEIVGRLGRDRLSGQSRQSAGYGRCDYPGNFYLDLEQVRQIAVVAFGPSFASGLTIYQMDREPQSLIGATDGADKEVANAQNFADFGRIVLLRGDIE